jgi:magnesium transporter
MNFDHMPELQCTIGYPLALVVMLLASATLYLVFTRQRSL